MAIWQCKIDYLPEKAVIEKYGALPVSIPDQDMDAVDWWASHQPPKELCSWSDGLLPESASWSSSLRIWGQEQERGNCVSVFNRSKTQNEVEWIEFRIDAQSLDVSFLSWIVTVAERLNCVLVTQENHVLKAELPLLVAAVRAWGFGPTRDWKLVQTLPEWIDTVKGFSGVANETGKRWYPSVGLQK